MRLTNGNVTGPGGALAAPGAASVLTINRVGFFGGVERIVVSCGQAVEQRGFHAIIACPMPGQLAEEAARRGIETVSLGIDRSKATASPLAWARLFTVMRSGRRAIVDLCRERGVRLLHAHHPIGALYAVPAARRLGIPLLLHVHETLPIHALYRTVARWIIPHCAAFACCSERSRELMLALGAPAARLRVIHNGVDQSFQGDIAAVPELAASPGPHIGLFGVLEPRKGQDVFIAAARVVAARHPTARFWIVGDLSFAENAAYVEQLRAAIRDAGLQDRIELTGHRRNVRDWMARMDAIVLASRGLEALPTVLIEGALLGRPLVATDVGGVREIIADGRTGLIVPPGEPAPLAAAILRSLDGEGPAFGAAARADAMQRFTFDRFGDDMAALYRSLLREPQALAA
jgi:glycosyltransferase involved in cell wall biosynthesis